MFTFTYSLPFDEEFLAFFLWQDLVRFKVGSRHEREKWTDIAPIFEDAELWEVWDRRAEMWNANGCMIDEKNLCRLYIKNMKLVGCYLRRNVRYKDLIKESQRVTFEIISHVACGRFLPFPLVILWNFHAQQARPSSTVSFPN